MCGIVGVFNAARRPADPQILRAMGATLAHRGPDDEGCVTDGPVGMFHKRLAIIDLKTGHQPMTFDGLTIVFNGEIYNYIELREELLQRGHTFRGVPQRTPVHRGAAEAGVAHGRAGRRPRIVPPAACLAAQHVKVCLGGQGGDEIFGGYARYVIAYLEQAIKGAIFETVEEGEARRAPGRR